MTFLSDVVSVAFLRDLITWTTTDAVLSQLTSPDQGVYLCGGFACRSSALQYGGAMPGRCCASKSNFLCKTAHIAGLVLLCYQMMQHQVLAAWQPPIGWHPFVNGCMRTLLFGGLQCG